MLLRADARFCSTKCRVYSGRKMQFPKQMTELPRWMRWARVDRGGRLTKEPRTVHGARGSSMNPAKWSTFEAAKKSTHGAGLGFALGAGIGCIDLDHCIVDGQLAPWARDILDRTPATYIEVSQSGTGLHIFGFLPERANRRLRDGEVAIEVYTGGQYIAATGDRFERAPLVLADLSEVVASVT